MESNTFIYETSICSGFDRCSFVEELPDLIASSNHNYHHEKWPTLMRKLLNI